MNQEPEIIQGVICAVVFHNYENGYAILRLNIGVKDPVTVTGIIPMPAIGEHLMVTGHWINHPTYGRQFESEFLERLLPQNAKDIEAYLASRIIKGIGPITAKRIVAHFGAETFTIMETQPHRLAEISGISKDKALAIGKEFQHQVGIRHLMEFFAQYQLPSELAVRTFQRYKDQAIPLLYDDPYLLMDEGLDAPFPIVDQFAITLGVSADDPKRIRAGILFELHYNLLEGHSFVPVAKLVPATATLLQIDSEEPVFRMLQELIDCDRLVSCTLAGLESVYLSELYEAECYCTQRLLDFADTTFPAPANWKHMLAFAASDCGLDYSQQQKQAMEESIRRGVLLLTGGPGTGKTTVLNGILSLFDQMGISCVLAAPTGRAAKRLTEVTGREASTIHRLLEAGIDPGTGQMCFLRDESNPLKADAYIIDEMSMVDIQLLHSLLQAIPARKRLIFVGDPDQLHPVGPGYPFRDMLRSGVIPTVRLTEIFRQAQQSLIVMNAHRVNKGELPELRNTSSDFFFLPCNSGQKLFPLVEGLCATRLPQRMNIPADQIQVLTPMRKSAVGTITLNRSLQAALNPPHPGKKERAFGDWIFREGDRVMQIRNNYDIMWVKCDGTGVGTGVFNGDIGIISAIDLQEETMTVIFDDRKVEYEFSQLMELELAYAMTVHKSQGSEYRAVILCLCSTTPRLLLRSILYTAITRARELLIIVGNAEEIQAMTADGSRRRRYTGLKLRLQGKV